MVSGMAQQIICRQYEYGKYPLCYRIFPTILCRMTYPLVALTTAQRHHKDIDRENQTSFKPKVVAAEQTAVHQETHRCQFIAGEPSMDDACKCGLPTDGASYCRLHRLFCTMPATPWNLQTALASASKADDRVDEDHSADVFGRWPIDSLPWTDTY